MGWNLAIRFVLFGAYRFKIIKVHLQRCPISHVCMEVKENHMYKSKHLWKFITEETPDHCKS